jgi:hypothetical protein
MLMISQAKMMIIQKNQGNNVMMHARTRMNVMISIIIVIKMRVKTGKNEIIMTKVMAIVVMKIPYLCCIKPSATSKQFKKRTLASFA